MKTICMVAYTNYLTDARPRREAETLVRRGDKVDFIGLAEEGRPSLEVVNGVRVFRVRQSRYRGGKETSYVSGYLTFFLRATLKVWLLFLKERHDIIYLHTMPDFIVFVALLPRILGARVVLNIHDMMPELFMSKFKVSDRHLLIRLLRLQEQVSIKFADKVICVHRPHRDVLVKRGAPGARITILPNLPDPEAFPKELTPPAHNGIFRVVYHGTVAKRLGLDIAVRAFARALQSCPNARFDIYGDGDFRNELDLLIQELGVHKQVYFSKKAFRIEQIAALLRGASVGLIANRRDPATDYMLPVKLLEYVYLSIPAIAPRLYTIQYYFKETELAFYEPGDLDGLTQTLCRLYRCEEERRQLATNALSFVSRFSWDVAKADLYNVVDSW